MTTQEGFDPTEVGVPWRYLVEAGHDVRFATPTGARGTADPRMVTGQDLAILKPFLRADRNGVRDWKACEASPAFQSPIAYEAIRADDFDALVLPGGHAKGMRVYLESPLVHAAIVAFFEAPRPVAAICHGTLAAARAISPRTGKSVLWGKRTTGLLRSQEMLAWRLTRLWLGDYYRTYDTPMETELRSFLRSPAEDFDPGPMPWRRDTPAHPGRGFTLRDGLYLSARWPGDAHRFGVDLLALLEDSP